MNLDLAVRKVIAELIHASAQSRPQIADHLRLVAPNCQLTLHMLNDFSAESKLKARFPAAWVPGFCKIMNDDRLQRLLLSPRQVHLLEWAEMNLDVAVSLKKIEVARQKLLNDLGEEG
jgi:hypothetical protein